MIGVEKKPLPCGPPGEGVSSLPIKYKIDVLEALKAAGFTTYKIRQTGLINQTALQRIREGKMISWEQLASICAALNLQPGDIVEFVPEEQSQE